MALSQNRSTVGPTGPAQAVGRSGATWAAGALWLAAGLSAGYWLLQAGGQGPRVPLKGLAPSAPQADVDLVGRALGALVVAASPEAETAPPARVRLLGVAAQGRSIGAALLAIDEQPPRPWRVGDQVTEGLVLQSVDRLGAKLGESRWGATTLELTMPDPKDQPPTVVRSNPAIVPRPAARILPEGQVPLAPPATPGGPSLPPAMEGQPSPG